MIRSLAAALLTAALTTGAALADDFPARPVKIIVPTPPGGPVDVIARITANYLQNALGKGMVVENRAGAGNTIGSKDAAEATPDGYTLLYSSASGLVIAPLLHPDAGYDPLKSFDPIALVGESSNILVVNPAVPANTVQELVAYAKANPGKVNFSSGGIGVLPHLIGEMFKARAGIDIVHVPYKGGGPSITDLVAGNVQMTFEGTSVLLPLIQAGRLRALAVTTAKRIRATARRADHGGERISRFRLDQLDRPIGAGAYAATDHRKTQRCDQCRAEDAGIESRAGATEQRAARRHASGFHQRDQGRSRQMVADRQVARARQAMSRRILLRTAGAALLVFCSVLPLHAQTYPYRPVKIIVPTVAAGTVDLVTRIMANDLGTVLGKQFFIENRSGAGNTLGSRDVAHSDPDGYTLLMSSASGQVISPLIYKDPGYDPLKSFAPIAPYAEGSVILVVNPSLPFQSVADLVAYAKANPGKLSYGSAGTGTVPHLTARIVQVGRGRIAWCMCRIAAARCPSRTSLPAICN